MQQARVWRYLAGLGSGLWLGNDLHGDDAVGFFLQEKTTEDKTLDLFKLFDMCP